VEEAENAAGEGASGAGMAVSGGGGAGGLGHGFGLQCSGVQVFRRWAPGGRAREGQAPPVAIVAGAGKSGREGRALRGPGSGG
jgi:hypothetical protein